MGDRRPSGEQSRGGDHHLVGVGRQVFRQQLHRRLGDDLGEVGHARRRQRVALPIVARADLPVVHVAGLVAEIEAVLDAEAHRRVGRSHLAR